MQRTQAVCSYGDLGGLRQLLVPRLTAVAARELQEVNDILSGVAPTDAEIGEAPPSQRQMGR